MARFLGRMLIAGATTLLATAPALAGLAVATPGPALGAGLPALAVFGAGYWLIRRRRRG